jgi:hypothetical protein
MHARPHIHARARVHGMHVYLIDSPAKVAAMISSLSRERVLAVDAEGVDLGATGAS